MTPEHARNDAADMAGREDDRCFQEVVEDIKPHLSEREMLMLELIELFFARSVSPNIRDHATEQMREIANVPDKMRRALMEISDRCPHVDERAEGGISDYGGNGDDMAYAYRSTAESDIGDIARTALNQ